MSKKILAVALDAADTGLIRSWVKQGLLPNFEQLINGGNLIELTNHPFYRNETPWVSLLTGCSPGQTGYWSPLRFDGSSYAVNDSGAYSFDPYRPFHALVSGLQVTIFDLPHCGRIFPSASGVQILGWGAHSPMCNFLSSPSELGRKLRRRFGANPAIKIQNRGSWWKNDWLKRLHEALIEGLRRRGAIMKVLLKEYPADLSVLTFGELHIAGHHFWHLSDQDHPAFGRNSPVLPDFLLDIYRETDRQLGNILDIIPGSTDLLLFSPEGGAPNWCDLNSMVFLPEFLFRWNFPGRALLETGNGDTSGPPVIPSFGDWVESVWNDSYSNLPPEWIPRFLHGSFRKMASIPGIHFPLYVLRRLGTLKWQPSVWYKPWWSQMRAFALPSYGDGYIRINIKGREANGIVDPDDTEPICQELRERLFELRDPRNNEPIVDDVIRPAENPAGFSYESHPDADLVVLWKRHPNDMVKWCDSERLGPIPFWKSGSHNPTGFIMSPDFQVSSNVQTSFASVIDIAPTILDLSGFPVPSYMQGRSLFMRNGQ